MWAILYAALFVSQHTSREEIAVDTEACDAFVEQMKFLNEQVQKTEAWANWQNRPMCKAFEAYEKQPCGKDPDQEACRINQVESEIFCFDDPAKCFINDTAPGLLRTELARRWYASGCPYQYNGRPPFSALQNSRASFLVENNEECKAIKNERDIATTELRNSAEMKALYDAPPCRDADQADELLERCNVDIDGTGTCEALRVRSQRSWDFCHLMRVEFCAVSAHPANQRANELAIRASRLGCPREKL